jgi:hypothetical protein
MSENQTTIPEVKQEVKVETKPEVKVNANQAVETAAYTPQYKIKPEFKQAVLKALGAKRAFNEIAGIINAINVPKMDHQTLTQVINVLGQFPYNDVEAVIINVNNYIELIVED